MPSFIRRNFFIINFLRKLLLEYEIFYHIRKTNNKKHELLNGDHYKDLLLIVSKRSTM